MRIALADDITDRRDRGGDRSHRSLGLAWE